MEHFLFYYFFSSFMGSKQKRGAVIKLFKEEKLAADIIKELDMHCRTVYNAVKLYREIETIKDRLRSSQLAWRIIKKQLKYRSYKFGNGHFLDERMKIKRVQNVCQLLKINDFRLILFTDKKIFPIERATNFKNNRQLLQKIIAKFEIFSFF